AIGAMITVNQNGIALASIPNMMQSQYYPINRKIPAVDRHANDLKSCSLNQAVVCVERPQIDNGFHTQVVSDCGEAFSVRLRAPIEALVDAIKVGNTVNLHWHCPLRGSRRRWSAHHRLSYTGWHESA